MVGHAGRLDFAGRCVRGHASSVATEAVTFGRRPELEAPRLVEGGPGPLLTDAERATLPKANRDEWVTRFWVVKEAVAKVRGRSMLGNLRRFAVTDIASNRLLVDGLWVETRNEGEHIVGWTES